MNSFKQYYVLVNEGGNVFKQNPTDRINLADIKPTLDIIANAVGFTVANKLLGSTGKKDTSGDIDIAVDISKYSKVDIYNKLVLWCRERGLDPELYVAKGAYVHFRCPIANQFEKYVQTDFMFVEDIKFAQHCFANNEEAPFKGVHRNILISNLAKNINLKFSPVKGLVSRETDKVVEDKNFDNLSKIILSDNTAKSKDLSNIPSIIKFLYKKYNDVDIVKGLISQAQQTILRTYGLDIFTYLPEKITESVDPSGKRLGVQHLYSQYKSNEYSMNFENIVRFVDALKHNNYEIDPGNSSISEKADGMAVRFGVDEEDRFFLAGSYSGPVFDGNFLGKIKHEPTRIAFEQSFLIIKKLVYGCLKRFKKEYDLPGVRVQAEWLYSPFALTRDDSPDVVYFVATNYQRDKLGKWSTFPIIDITGFNGEQISDDAKAGIEHDLISLSNNDVKFLPLGIDAFTPINLRQEAIKLEEEIHNFEFQHPDFASILYSTSRKRADQKARKDLRIKITNKLLPIQKRMHEKILKSMDRIAGKLGEYEGLVIKINTNEDPFIFKVISPTFHKNKGRL